MQNYKITIEYDGTDFDGWQNQKGENNTIQGNLERSFKIILREEVKITGAGRTDAGVHALGQITNFKCSKKFDSIKIAKAVNALLPEQITVLDINEADENFHARYSAKAREYEYRISFRRRSIDRNYFFYLKYSLNEDIMQRAIEIFKGKHSFKSLCKNKEDKHDFNCDIKKFSYIIDRKDESLIFTVKADRFLHSMVRALIGTIVDAGRGKLSLKEIKTNFTKGDKIRTTYLPAHGLLLKKIYY